LVRVQEEEQSRTQRAENPLSREDKAIAFINEHANDKGYVNLDMLMGKSGEPYLKLNTFVPKPKADVADAVADVQEVEIAEATSDDLPF